MAQQEEFTITSGAQTETVSIPRAGEFVVEIGGDFGTAGTVTLASPGGVTYTDHDAVGSAQIKVLSLAAGDNDLTAGGTPTSITVRLTRMHSAGPRG